MADQYCFTYNSIWQTNFFHLPNKDIWFTRMGMNLYIFKPPPICTQVATALLNTVEENTKFNRMHQFDRAKNARDLYNTLGTPSVNDFKAIFITNNPVTTDDNKIAEKIFGPEIGAIKRKTTRQNPVPIVDDYVLLVIIPKEFFDAQQEATLCIDRMKVNRLSFLTTIFHNMYYRMAQWVQNHTS